MLPPWLPAGAESDGMQQRNKRSTRAALQESQGRSFVTALYPQNRTEIMFSPNDPKSKWIHSPTARKYVIDNKHKEKKRKDSSNLQASTSGKHRRPKCTG